MRSLLPVPILLLPILAACASTAPLPEPVLDGSAVADFDQVRPVRILVGPVEEAGETGAPLETIREAFYRGLIERRYSPYRLDLDPAALPPDPAAGTLVVRIAAWDRSPEVTPGLILASGEAWLGRGDRKLWSASFENLHLRCSRENESSSRAERDARAASALSSSVLRSLPVKAD